MEQCPEYRKNMLGSVYDVRGGRGRGLGCDDDTEPAQVKLMQVILGTSNEHIEN